MLFQGSWLADVLCCNKELLLSCSNFDSRGGPASLGNTRKSNEDPRVSFLWMASSILGMAKTDWKADVHSHKLCWQRGKIGEKDAGRHITRKNFPWTIWRINTFGRAQKMLWCNLFYICQRLSQLLSQWPFRYTGGWANVSVFPVKETDEISKAALRKLAGEPELESTETSCLRFHRKPLGSLAPAFFRLRQITLHLWIIQGSLNLYISSFKWEEPWNLFCLSFYFRDEGNETQWDAPFTGLSNSMAPARL